MYKINATWLYLFCLTPDDMIHYVLLKMQLIQNLKYLKLKLLLWYGVCLPPGERIVYRATPFRSAPM